MTPPTTTPSSPDTRPAAAAPGPPWKLIGVVVLVMLTLGAVGSVMMSGNDVRSVKSTAEGETPMFELSRPAAGGPAASTDPSTADGSMAAPGGGIAPHPPHASHPPGTPHPSGGGMAAPFAPMAGAGAMIGDVPPPAAAATDFAWTLPSGWQVEPGEGFRLLTFRPPAGVDGRPAQAEVAVTYFRGDGGGRLANLNRWRGQLDLPPVGEAEVAAHFRPLEGALAGDGAAFAEERAADGKTALTAALLPISDGTVFLKLAGTTDAVAAHTPAFKALAASFRLAEAK